MILNYELELEGTQFNSLQRAVYMTGFNGIEAMLNGFIRRMTEEASLVANLKPGAEKEFLYYLFTETDYQTRNIFLKNMSRACTLQEEGKKEVYLKNTIQETTETINKYNAMLEGNSLTEEEKETLRGCIDVLNNSISAHQEIKEKCIESKKAAEALERKFFDGAYSNYCEHANRMSFEPQEKDEALMFLYHFLWSNLAHLTPEDLEAQREGVG